MTTLVIVFTAIISFCMVVVAVIVEKQDRKIKEITREIDAHLDMFTSVSKEVAYVAEHVDELDKQMDVFDNFIENAQSNGFLNEQNDYWMSVMNYNPLNKGENR